jgi:MmgE/PrpD C-terminal domain
VTSWQRAVHPSDPSEQVFGRDLLQVEILNASRTRRLFTLFNTHMNVTHAGVDAALRLRAQGLAPADVTAIELGVAKPVLRTIAEPPEAKARPASGYHAAFSGPYTVAAALLGGGGLGVSHEDFTDAAAHDPAASPWPPRCAASRTSAAARRSRTPSPPSCA